MYIIYNFLLCVYCVQRELVPVCTLFEVPIYRAIPYSDGVRASSVYSHWPHCVYVHVCISEILVLSLYIYKYIIII